MKNRRVFQRNDCSISVVVHKGGRFLYGEIVDLSLGGVRLALKGPLQTEKVELSPHKAPHSDLAIIPLPYDVRWKQESSAGLQFAGGTDAFFRGWLSDHLKHDPADFTALLDNRQLVRIPCQLSGKAESDEGRFDCSVLDVSLGGLSFISAQELWPGMTLQVTVEEHPELGRLELILLRVQSLTDHYLCGGQFLEPDDKQVEALGRVVEQLATRHREATLDE